MRPLSGVIVTEIVRLWDSGYRTPPHRTRMAPPHRARIRLLRALCSTSARPSTSSTGGT